jgi:outer membrane protein OmpA-like peptidoglycan-associated protein
MKIHFKFFRVLVLLLLGFFIMPNANAQILKKLKKRAERTVERKLEQKTEKETGKVMDSILDPNEKTEKSPQSEDSSNNSSGSTNSDDNSETTTNNPNVSDDLEVYSKFDFVPGDKLLYFDDFSQDFIGDFPSKWNTNGSGEVIKLNKAEGNWFEIKPGYKIQYIPLLKSNLPAEYTIEFDLLTDGLDNKTRSTAVLNISLDESKTFNDGRNFSLVNIPFGQYDAFGIRVKSVQNSDAIINSVLTADIRDEVKNKPHISIAVNTRRFRLWINEVKYVDIPQFIPEGNILTTLKFNLQNFKDGTERLFIQNLKIAEGGLDLRRTLMTDGRVSTNGILFNSGSANIQPQSLGIVRQISQVLLQEETMRLNIVGHTDSDGNDDTNLKLSKDRAMAVKNALVDIYNISADRLQTDGKGESIPVGDNGTADGKAQNRRVEFIKI